MSEWVELFYPEGRTWTVLIGAICRLFNRFPLGEALGLSWCLWSSLLIAVLRQGALKLC